MILLVLLAVLALAAAAYVSRNVYVGMELLPRFEEAEAVGRLSTKRGCLHDLAGRLGQCEQDKECLGVEAAITSVCMEFAGGERTSFCEGERARPIQIEDYCGSGDDCATTLRAGLLLYCMDSSPGSSWAGSGEP